jgi:Tfp pilus assembly protein PilV
MENTPTRRLCNKSTGPLSNKRIAVDFSSYGPVDLSRKRRGVALIDVIIGAVMLGVCLAVLISLTGRSLASQTDGEKRVIASWLIDEIFAMVLIEGPIEYARRYDRIGRFYKPFDEFGFEVQIEDLGPGNPHRVTASVGWESMRGVQSITAQTLIAERLGDPDQPRKPKERVDRETRHYERIFGPPEDEQPRPAAGRPAAPDRGTPVPPARPAARPRGRRRMATSRQIIGSARRRLPHQRTPVDSSACEHAGMSCRRRRAGFTLAEVVIATTIIAFVLGSLSMSMSQLGRAKESSRLRLDAHLRADAALNAIRRDVASVIRHEDLFWTRLLIRSSTVASPIGTLDRDDILVFNTRLRAMFDLDFNGEGMQYETQFRIFEGDDFGAVLRQRRDAVPDEFPLAGGIDTPLVEGIIGLRFQAYDGIEWFDDWDSDELGLPHAVRITVVASGARPGPDADMYDAPIAILRTTVPIDRVLPPADLFIPDDDEDEQQEELEDVSDYQAEEARRRGNAGRRGGAEGPGPIQAPGRRGERPSPGSPGAGSPGAMPPAGGGRPGSPSTGRPGAGPGDSRPGGQRPSGRRPAPAPGTGGRPTGSRPS